MDQTGEELCLWQNEAPDKLIWKVIASKTNVNRKYNSVLAWCARQCSALIKIHFQIGMDYSCQ